MADIGAKGPLWPIWDKAFGPAHSAWEMKQRYGNKNVCYQNLMMGMPGASHPICQTAASNECRDSHLIKAYADFVVRGLNLQLETPYAKPPKTTLVITWIARKVSDKWPEAQHCEDGDTFWKCELLNATGSFYERKRPLGRMIANEISLTDAIKEKFEKVTPPAPYKDIKVNYVDFIPLTLEKQVATIVATDIMIGPHGAGLTHNLWLHEGAVTVELKVAESGSLMHFHNLAVYSDQQYIQGDLQGGEHTGEVLDPDKKAFYHEGNADAPVTVVPVAKVEALLHEALGLLKHPSVLKAKDAAKVHAKFETPPQSTKPKSETPEAGKPADWRSTPT